MKTELVERGDQMPSDVAADVLSNGGAMQQMRTPYATAVMVQRPRRLAEVERRILEEARLAGESFYYGWGAGKDKIEGPSQDLAFSLARCWGNCAVEQQPVQDLPDAWVFTATFVDLETGFTYSRQFRQSKQWTVYGKLDPERKADIRFQIGQTKAARNVIFKALPQRLIDRAVEEAKAGVRKKIEEFVAKNGLAAAVKSLVTALAKETIKLPQILAKFDIADERALTIDHLVVLRGDLAAIHSGNERADSLFPAPASDADAMARDLAGKASSSPRDASANEPGVIPEPAPPTQPDASQAATEGEPLDVIYSTAIETAASKKALAAVVAKIKADPRLDETTRAALLELASGRQWQV